MNAGNLNKLLVVGEKMGLCLYIFAFWKSFDVGILGFQTALM